MPDTEDPVKSILKKIDENSLSNSSENFKKRLDIHTSSSTCIPIIDGDMATTSSSDTCADTGSGLGRCGVPISAEVGPGGSLRAGTGERRRLIV